MKNRTMSGGLVSSLLAVVASFGVGCSDKGDPSTFEPGPAAPPGFVGTDPDQVANGWASVDAVTNGGADADEAHTYVVTNRTELVRALYPDAVIADDGSFTSANGSDDTPKIIYVRGTISLNTNLAGRELTLEDYACEGYSFEAYKAAYDPTIWNRTLADGEPREILPCPGSQEELRECSRRRQRAVVQIRVGSNTSIFGDGKDAKIVHGHLVIGGGAGSDVGSPPSALPPLDEDLAEACGLPPPDPLPAEPPALDPAVAIAPTAENVIIRNITFEDAFDFFPAWDPTDSYSEPPEVADPADPFYPQCQLTLDPLDGTGAGPHKCPGGRWNSQFDNITVQNARHVWIDNNTFNDGDRETQDDASIWAAPYDLYQNRVQPHDGLLDINGTSDMVTVSRNIFRNHDKVMLIGGSDTVRDTNGWGYLNVTVHHNQFINCGQRMPRVRFGKVHVYNNVIRGTLFPVIETPEDRANKPLPDYPMGSALTVGHLAKVYSENNVFNITKGHEDDPDPVAADVISLAHRETPTEGDTPDVGEQTYFFDNGTDMTPGSTLNGDPAGLMMSVAEQVAEDEDPPVPSTADVWKPADDYRYTAIAAGGVNAELGRLSGAGKLSISGMPQ